MANWKELGEIPDSEDEEGFDSQRLDSHPIETNTEPAAENPREPDIWDIPDSPNKDALPLPKPPSEHAPSYSGSSSPLSTVPDLSEEDIATFPRGSRVASRDDSPLAVLAPEREPIQPASPPSTQNSPALTVHAGDLLQPELLFNADSASYGDEGLRNLSETAAARQVAIRYERSLRPRKPIQQHPYVLENAQYSSVLKLHGVKPLRMAIENGRRKRDHQSGLSQEEEFQEESQETAETGLLDDQSIGEARFPTDTDNLAVPSSTPHWGSPTGARVGASSLVSSQAESDNTSILDDDLPALDELLRKPPKLTSTKRDKRSTTPLGASIRKRARRNSLGNDLVGEDLPAIDELLIKPLKLTSTKRDKGNTTPLRSSVRKRSRRIVLDSDPVDEDSIRIVSAAQSPSSAVSPSLRMPRPAPVSPTRNMSLLACNRSPTLSVQPDAANSMTPSKHLTYISSDEDEKDENTPEHDDSATVSSDGASASESEAVTNMSRRIRGVLPASWLRLDQQAGRDNAKRSMNHRGRLLRSPGREHRRGVAQQRQGTGKRNSKSILYDESDAEEHTTMLNEEIQNDSLAASAIGGTENQDREPVLNIDDEDSSVVEDNGVDFMLSKPSRKRQLQLTDGFDGGNRTRLKRHHPASKQRHKKLKQVGIEAHLHKPGVDNILQTPVSANTQKQKSSKRGTNHLVKRHVSKKARMVPTKLSILDTIESDAPQFLKIAARTARSRRNQGRSSPSRKIIQLATRQDQLDAASVLSSWRLGFIKPRNSVTAAIKPPRGRRNHSVLAEASVNRITNTLPKTQRRPNASRKLVKQISTGGSIKYLPSQGSPQQKESKSTQKIIAVKKRYLHSAMRPAQLETNMNVPMSNSEFESRKRFLDRLYQNGHSAVRWPGGKPPSKQAGRARDSTTVMQTTAEQPAATWKGRPSGSRNRKKAPAQRIDVNAPQYTYAKDPVPEQYLTEPVSSAADPSGHKFVGLGPYGTTYTNHFEILPLCSGVFFHESTLIGSGELQTCASMSFTTSGLEARPHISLSLNSHVLRWGVWNDQVSSELGVVLDHIAEYVERLLTGNPDTSPNETSPVEAAQFVLSYIKRSIKFVEQDHRSSFIPRACACLESLNKRVDAVIRTDGSFSAHNSGQILQTYDRLLLIVFLMLRFCKQDPSLMAEQLTMEKSIQSLGATVTRMLAALGIGNLQKLYRDMNTNRVRERGFRSDSHMIHSWVMVMKIFELAQIPRASFWDIAQHQIAPSHDVSSVNAQDHERVWEHMFTLLPLVEFGDTGVLMPGRRHTISNDGWKIPQMLLRQVFQLYERNPRQAASFNNYCRALVGRCHQLVQEWGWLKCVSIVGLIFDFFGSHQLAHLRNEEVHKSPSFLDNLGGRPKLGIEPADACFHVFLKLIAVAIKRFRDAGFTKDIGNLVTRTVPNHNRQHRKDEHVHARDLAALRNHHDLLCTLFWAAPSEYRPSPSLIQNLVDPTDSHREACLINLRAWTQLARFIIVSGDVGTSWKPFHLWRVSFFDQVLTQVNSVASAVARQVSGLGTEASRSITEEMVKTAVSVNRAALIDVLHASLTASLHVVQNAPDLQTATYAWNITQLRTIFTHFSVTPPDLTWGLLKASLDILDTMLSKIDEFKAQEESQQSESQILNSAVADDALLHLDQNLSKAFFSMGRRVLSNLPENADCHPGRQEQTACPEQIVILAARMSMRFVNGGLMRLSGAFKGNYQLFTASPHMLDLRQRRYMVLFVSTLLRCGIDDFDDAGLSLCEVWLSSIAKPRAFLTYEMELGKELLRHGQVYVPEAVAGICVQPDYDTNHDLFEFALSSMRKSIRDAGPNLRGTLTTEYSSALKACMEQIKSDLKSVVGIKTAEEHNNYVLFVQRIVSLIKTHASDICAVDNYFFQISKEYSPSAEDPQLKVANLKSYGLRLQEGDDRIGQSLFHLLFNNAKFSIFRNNLTEEVYMLGRAMANDGKAVANNGIKTFILSKMLPAIIKASFEERDAFPLLDIYMEAIELCFAGKAMSVELFADDLPAICILKQIILDGLKKLQEDGGTLTGSQIHLVRQVIGLGNLFWPFLHVLSMSKPEPEGWRTLHGLLTDLWAVISNCESYLQDLNNMDVQAGSLLLGTREAQSAEYEADSGIHIFAENVIQDVRKNWNVTGDKIKIHIPGQNIGAATAASYATVVGWKEADLIDELHQGVREWSHWWRKANGISCLGNIGSVIF